MGKIIFYGMLQCNNNEILMFGITFNLYIKEF